MHLVLRLLVLVLEVLHLQRTSFFGGRISQAMAQADNGAQGFKSQDLDTLGTRWHRKSISEPRGLGASILARQKPRRMRLLLMDLDVHAEVAL